MMQLERVLLSAGIGGAGVAVAFAAVRLFDVSPLLGVAVGLGVVLMGILVVFLTQHIADTHFRRPTVTWRVRLDNLTVQLSRRRHEADLDILLPDVRAITWYVSPFSREETVRLEFWDGPPPQSPTMPSEGLHCSSSGAEGRSIGFLRSTDLLASPEAHWSLCEYLLPRIESGLVTTTIDLRTLKPLEPSQPIH